MKRVIKRLLGKIKQLRDEVQGAVFVEYLLLTTLIGIGVICGLAVLKDALIAELRDLAEAIRQITCP